jgi:ribosomal RNA-processing protein 8
LEESQEDSPVKVSKNDRKRKHSKSSEVPEKKLKKIHETVPAPAPAPVPQTYQDKLRESLKGSRFRYINELLYTQKSQEAMRIFDEDGTAFEAYHEGYRHQIAQWPMNPLDRIIKQINKM